MKEQRQSPLKEKLADCVPRNDPVAPPFYIEAEAQAIRALWRGKASEHQQRIAMDYMIRAFGTHDTSYRPDDSLATAFAEGKRFAGTTLVWMLKSAPTRTDPDKIAVREVGEQDG